MWGNGNFFVLLRCNQPYTMKMLSRLMDCGSGAAMTRYRGKGAVTQDFKIKACNLVLMMLSNRRFDAGIAQG